MLKDKGRLTNVRKIFISLQRPEVVGNPRGQVTSLNKVLGGLSSFLRNIVFYLHPVPHKGYTMLNLGESLLWHLAERGVVHTSRPGANCFKKN